MRDKKKKNIVLYIDSSDNRKISVILDINGKKSKITKITNTWASQILLPLIDDLLKNDKISVFHLTEIRVNPGPGSFTGTRVGVSIANTLGWLLGIPVNGKDCLVEPIY